MDTTTVTTTTVTLLFTDLVGSTRLLDRLGDEAAGRLRRKHFALLRQEIAATDGEEVKSLGDGLMVAFRSAQAALVCAVAMQRAVAADNRSGHPLQIRVGLHCGETHREEGDFFGTAVVVARRLCDTAQGGEILASDGSEPEFPHRTVGPLPLKGLSQPVPAVAVDWRASHTQLTGTPGGDRRLRWWPSRAPADDRRVPPGPVVASGRRPAAIRRRRAPLRRRAPRRVRRSRDVR